MRERSVNVLLLVAAAPRRKSNTSIQFAELPASSRGM